MIILNSELDKLDQNIETLAESGEQDNYTDHALIHKDVEEGDVIVAYEPAWRVADLGIIVAEGVYCNPEPDWSLTLIYEDVPDDEFDPDEWLYYEQDPPVTAIHNFMQGPLCWNC